MALSHHAGLGCPGCLHFPLALSVQVVHCSPSHPEWTVTHLYNALLHMKVGNVNIYCLLRTSTHRWASLACWAFRSCQSNWTLVAEKTDSLSKITRAKKKDLFSCCVNSFPDRMFIPLYDAALILNCTSSSIKLVWCQSQFSRQSQSVNQSTSSPSRPVSPSCPGAPLDPWKCTGKEKNQNKNNR